jgi:hypothetical protein
VVPVLDHESTVDDDVLDALGIAVGIFEGGAIGDAARVEQR